MELRYGTTLMHEKQEQYRAEGRRTGPCPQHGKGEGGFLVFVSWDTEAGYSCMRLSLRRATEENLV